MGLVVARKVDEVVELYVKPGTDPEELAAALSAGIAIRIHSVQGIRGEQPRAWLDIEAPEQITVVRQELRQSEADPAPSRPVMRLRRNAGDPA